MLPDNQETTLETLQEIRTIMDRSARFLSLSGWSGVWAGFSALAGAGIAYSWMKQPDFSYVINPASNGSTAYFDTVTVRFLLLAIGVFAAALAGGLYFTLAKAKKLGQKPWNSASRQLMLQLFIPIFAGAVFTMALIYYGQGMLIAPACLMFYGLGLISASRYTLSDIRYLGMLNLALGCFCLFFPGYGLYFWAVGFGVLHILYGVMMWNKYDKRQVNG